MSLKIEKLLDSTLIIKQDKLSDKKISKSKSKKKQLRKKNKINSQRVKETKKSKLEDNQISPQNQKEIKESLVGYKNWGPNTWKLIEDVTVSNREDYNKFIDKLYDKLIAQYYHKYPECKRLQCL